MKKIIKSNKKTTLTIIATALICIYGTSHALEIYNAKDITYKNSNNLSISNVSGALDDLYNKTKIDYLNKNYDLKYNYSLGVRNIRSSSLELESGNYIIYGNSVFTATNVTSNVEQIDIYKIEISKGSASCNELKNSRFISHSSDYITGTKYSGAVTSIGIWSCQLTEKTTISISTSKDLSGLTNSAEGVIINAIKLT